jgi:predicted N-acetyltransferase YhbS
MVTTTRYGPVAFDAIELDAGFAEQFVLAPLNKKSLLARLRIGSENSRVAVIEVWLVRAGGKVDQVAVGRF